MGFHISFFIFTLLFLVQSCVFKVIPKDHQREEWDFFEKDADVRDEMWDAEEDHIHDEKAHHTDAVDGKIKKHKRKNVPKASIIDTIYPDRPNLVLLTFPSEFMTNEKEKLLKTVDSKFGHLLDVNVLKKIADGDMNAMPNVWNFLSNFDVRGAFTALLSQQFFQNFASVHEQPAVHDVTQEECKKLCKDKEVELFQLINGSLIRLTQMEDRVGEDIRVRARPGTKKYYKYSGTVDHKQPTCSCISAAMNIYVSPHVKEIFEEKFINSKNGEKEIENLIEHNFIVEKPVENKDSGWSLVKLGQAFLHNIGYGSEKRRAREPKRYDKHWFASKTEWILLNAVINILILGFCFPLWPFHVMFFLIGWFFV